jgi:serine/threonine protein kinase
MGMGISVNYDITAQLFTTGFWKVSSAVHKETNESVSLWVMDYDSVVKSGPRQDQKKFLEASLQSIQQMKRLRHPSVLKIVEASENPGALDFAAEPVMSCLSQESSLSPDDASYLAFQLAGVLQFLHQSARTVMFGLSNESICVTRTLGLKICAFTWSAHIPLDGKPPAPRLGDFCLSPFHPPLNFCSVEYVMSREPRETTDIFSFGCIYASMVLNRNAFDSATPDEYSRVVSLPITYPAKTSPVIAEVVKACLNRNPSRRPSFDEIMAAPPFTTLALRALRYVDVILTKPPDDKYIFFRGLAETIPTFSIRVLQAKMLPLFMSEVLGDPLFGTLLIPLIFEVARTLDRTAFFQDVMVPLADLLVSPNPPQCLYAVVCTLPTIIGQTDDDRQFEVCYPIIAAALGTHVAQIHQETLRHVPLLISRMSSGAVESLVVPGLLNLFSQSDDARVACACVRALAECPPKLAHGAFCEKVCPRITAAWNRLGEPADLTDAAWCVVQKLNPPPEVAMKEVVPMVSELLASDSTEPPTQVVLCKYIKEATAALIAPKKGQSAQARPKAPPLAAKRWQTKQPDDAVTGSEPEPLTDIMRWQAKPAAEEPPVAAATDAPTQDVPLPGMFAGLATRQGSRSGSKRSNASMFSGLKMSGKSNQ